MCDKNISGGLSFCRQHYKEYKDEITEKKPWVRMLRSEAQKQRLRREREYGDTSLEGIMDAEYERRHRR